MSCVLVVGSGGREHALLWSLAKSSHVSRLLVAPGNGGTTSIAKSVDVHADDIAGLVNVCLSEHVDFVVVGPEAPLAGGLVDELQTVGVPAFGPSAAAARLESSKAYCKQFLVDNRIPTAAAKSFTDMNKALAYLHSFPSAVPAFPSASQAAAPPMPPALAPSQKPSAPAPQPTLASVPAHAPALAPVVKASGLAAGKGVIVTESLEEAELAVRSMLDEKRFGEAGAEILIEERLVGVEVSVLAFCDGEHFLMLPPAQDYKRLNSGDTGPNTGGMGAVAPSSVISKEMLHHVGESVFTPTLAALKHSGTPYKGLLYAGLMLTDDGPKVLEFNCRFGDPETQAVLRLLESDLFEIMQACVSGGLKTINIEYSNKVAVAVVMASAGYPSSRAEPVPIYGIESAEKQGCVVFHAGTATHAGTVTELQPNLRTNPRTCAKHSVLQTNGGRVLAVTAVADDLEMAADRAHQGVSSITFEGSQHRSDIGRNAPPPP